MDAGQGIFGSFRPNQDFLTARMESTGRYWFPIHSILGKPSHVAVGRPASVKEKEAGKKDAWWIAGLFKHGLRRPPDGSI